MGLMAGEPTTAEEVLGTLTQVREVCGRLDPSVLGDHEVPGVFDAVVAMQRLVSGAVTRLTARYEESGAWKRNGAKSPEDEVARKTGTSNRSARRKLATSKRLAKHPKTDDAVRRGELSDEQADEVSSGADASPEDEDRSVGLGGYGSVARAASQGGRGPGQGRQGPGGAASSAAQGAVCAALEGSGRVAEPVAQVAG